MTDGLQRLLSDGNALDLLAPTDLHSEDIHNFRKTIKGWLDVGKLLLNTQQTGLFMCTTVYMKMSTRFVVKLNQDSLLTQSKIRFTT